MIELDNDSFNESIKHGNSIVDFFATYCGPCRALAQFMVKLEKEYNEISFYKVNVEDCCAVTEEFNVQSLPCVIFFSDGKEMSRVVGNNQSKISEIIKSF